MTAAPGNPWLDAARFGARRQLPSLARESAPAEATTPLGAGLDRQVAAVWAQQMQWPGGSAVAADELVLCGSGREALGLALGGLLIPGDTVLVARPAAVDALATVLGRGARYVDVGRLHDGAVDAAAAARAAGRHPDAVAWMEAPGLLAEDDAPAWAGVAVRARIADLRHAGWPTALPEADAVLLALRDPDAPGTPVLWAVAARGGAAGLLGAIGGAGDLPAGTLSRSAAVLRGWAVDPGWVAAVLRHCAERARLLSDLALVHPG
ncbi:MAG: hypothetical protein FJ100_09595, partial [Deltaproteobacteria bacterium]|nr:hypothetical protein [Deltaproteobacteria bacterium]